MIDNLPNLSKQELQMLVRAMAWNDAMGCHTRAGFEKWIWPEIKHKARWIVYFDVDGVHHINEQAGTYDAFDAMMKQIFSTVRSTDIVAGNFKSGDEFLICLIENDERSVLDPAGLVKRLTDELEKHGLSAIFAVTPVTSAMFIENVKPASDQVLADKKARGISR